MKLGMFMMPVNDHRRDTHTVLKEDVEIAVACDRLGFDEFWIGEHYTTLSEPVTCPFMFLSNLIARTERMKLGTGVVNLPQRHPVQTAAHAALLDHLSDGRLILGVSPGGLVSDFEMFGVTDLQVRREMAGEAVETVLKLWSTEPPYDIRGKYWTLRLEDYHWPDLGVGAMIKPYQKPHPPLVASAMSPDSGGVRSAAARGWGRDLGQLRAGIDHQEPLAGLLGRLHGERPGAQIGGLAGRPLHLRGRRRRLGQGLRARPPQGRSPTTTATW